MSVDRVEAQTLGKRKGIFLRTRLRDADAGISYVKINMIGIILQFDVDGAPQRVCRKEGVRDL